MDELLQEVMNRVSAIVSNPAYLDKVTEDEAVEIAPVDLTPLISGSAPIVNAPASEDGEVAEDEVEDGNDDEAEGLLKVMQEVLVNLEELNKDLRDLTSPLQRGASTQ